MASFNKVFKEKEIKRVTHPNRKIEWIHYSKLQKSEFQFYSEEQIELLANLIIMDEGIQQNLVIKKLDADSYEILAGHRRAKAAKYITEVMKVPGYELLPCIINNISEVRARLQVISTNQYRTKSAFEIMKEIEEMEYLLKNFPEEFPHATGRMVEKIASEMQMKRSTVGEYQTMAKNLGEVALEALENGTIEKSAAVALAGLAEEEQAQLVEEGKAKLKDIKAYKAKKKLEESNRKEVSNSHKSVQELFWLQEEMREKSEEEIDYMFDSGVFNDIVYGIVKEVSKNLEEDIQKRLLSNISSCLDTALASELRKIGK